MKENLLPNAIDIEEAVLGAILLQDSECEQALELLTPNSFYKVEHYHIYEAITQVKQARKKADILTVTEQLRKNQTLKICGGPGYIAKLTNRIASAAYIDQHALILKEKETARRYIHLGHRLIEQAQTGTDPFKINGFAIDEVHSIMGITVLKKEISNFDLANELVSNMNAAAANHGVHGFITGFSRYDQLTGGNKPGDFIVLAGRPGMGKTAFALCCALNAVLLGQRIIFFTLEMTALQLFKRLCAIYMGIDGDKLKTGNLTQWEWNNFNNHLQFLIDSPIVIVDDCKSVFEMQHRAKKELSKGGLNAVFIDYIQLMKPDHFDKSKSRENVVSEISLGCKEMAKDLGVPVYGLAQLSRSVETRGGDKRPMLSDLRESGSLEQDADMVVFTYRPSYYGIEEEFPGAAYLLIAKHRDGALDDVPLQYIHAQTKFINV